MLITAEHSTTEQVHCLQHDRFTPETVIDSPSLPLSKASQSLIAGKRTEQVYYLQDNSFTSVTEIASPLSPLSKASQSSIAVKKLLTIKLLGYVLF